MAEPQVFKLEFEYIQPSNVESEVPGDQKLREDDGTATNENAVSSNELALQDSNLEVSNTDEDPNRFVFAPVITVTEKEAFYTKGDVKLQKVSVTENISDPGINGAVYCTINSNPNIQSGVIHGQSVRVHDGDKSDDDKPKTRIPMMKFKHAVDKVKTDRRSSLDKKDEIPSSRLNQKRSSIPILRRPSVSDTKTEVPQPDDEFDKLYHEIIENDPKEIVIENNEVKLQDPVKLENKFEEIIHDYEDNKSKVQPVHVDKKHTKIPLFKRKSDQDIKLSTEKDNKKYAKPGKMETGISSPNNVKKPITKYDILKTEGNLKTNIKLPTKIREPEIKKQGSILERTKEIQSKPKVVTATTKLDSKTKEHNNYTLPKFMEQRSYLEESASGIDKTKVEDVKLSQPLDITIIDPVKVISTTEFERKISESNHYSVTTPQASLYEAQLEDNPAQINIIHYTVIEHQSGILAEADYNNEPKENIFEEINKEAKIKVNVDNNTCDIIKNNNDLFRNQNRIITYEPTVNTINEIEVTSEQIITVEYTPDNANEGNEILENQDTTNENMHISDDIQYIDDTEYTPGKVSRILKRIRSKEFQSPDVEKDKKEEIVDIPKKKSVLSKIAMFESNEPLPTSKSRVSPKLPTKPLCKDELLENVSRKPIIVDELLKLTEEDKLNEKTIVQESNQTNNEENNKKEYVIKIGDESVEYHEVQFIKDLDQTELSVVTNDEINAPISIATCKFEPNPIINEVQVLEPLKTDYLKPPIQNVEEKMPITEVVIESLRYKPIEYEFKNEILDNADAEVLSEEKEQNRIFENRPIKIDYIQPPIRNMNDKIPMNEVTVKLLENKPIEYEFKEEIFDDNEVFCKDIEKNRRPRRFKSRQESRKDRAKSVAEIDVGNIVKGRVHEMIERMNSIDILDVHKKVIDAKERPRKKSVSTIVALFEQKSSPTNPPIIYRHGTNTKLTVEQASLSEEEYEIRNKELINGKINYGRIENMTYLVLANGVEMPVLALGTALMDKRLTRNIIGAAIDMGYRAIDTAYIYGNEKEVGEAIRAKIEDGTVVREDLFITSKLWSTYHRPDLVPRACKGSLEVMGLDYFDLYLIHNPMSFKEGINPIPKIANVIQYSEYDYLDAWYGMEALVSKGLAKSIGVSNFNSAQVQRILDRSKIKPVINQVECHPYLSQQRLDEFCGSRDIKLCCFGVLGSMGTPPEMKSNLPPVFDDPLVKVMASGLNISVAQLLIRYQIDSGRAVVVKASSAARLWDDLQALQVSLTQPQLDALNALNKNKRTFTFMGMGDTHRNYPFKIPF